MIRAWNGRRVEPCLKDAPSLKRMSEKRRLIRPRGPAHNLNGCYLACKQSFQQRFISLFLSLVVVLTGRFMKLVGLRRPAHAIPRCISLHQIALIKSFQRYSEPLLGALSNAYYAFLVLLAFYKFTIGQYCGLGCHHYFQTTIIT